MIINAICGSKCARYDPQNSFWITDNPPINLKIMKEGWGFKLRLKTAQQMYQFATRLFGKTGCI
jgi:hypothetical protein